MSLTRAKITVLGASGRRALGSGRHHVLTSQVETESKRTEPQRVILQQRTASNSCLLVVIADDSQTTIIGSLSDVPPEKFKYDAQVSANNPIDDAQTDVFHPITQPSP